MDLTKYLAVLLVLCLKDGETGGGGKHHDHVKLHIPEFHHHGHHKKVITIHHHHHQPKKEHHHHHIHLQKPQIPHGHHYSHHHKKVHLKTTTVSKGAGGHHGSHGHHHKHHGHHHNHHGHHGHHAHHGHHSHHDYPSYGHHYDAPVVPPIRYAPNAIPSYEDEFTPSVPLYDSGIPITGFSAPRLPQVHGVTHTVKQVKVFDSLPGALPSKSPTHGYEVTEEGEEGEEAFVALNNLQNSYPATFGYVRAAASQQANDPFEGISSHSAVEQIHDPFAPVPTSGSTGNFIGSVQNNPFPSSVPSQSFGVSSASPSAEYPTAYHDTGFDESENSFTGSDVEQPSFLTSDENTITVNEPVTFAREAGIQHTTKTGNVETLVY